MTDNNILESTLQRVKGGGVNQNGSSKCPYCNKQVKTNKYVQALPYSIADGKHQQIFPEDSPRKAHLIKWKRGAIGDCMCPWRIANKKFICLSHEPAEIVAQLDFDVCTEGYMLKHRPQSGSEVLDADQLRRMIDPAQRLWLIQDGREVVLDEMFFNEDTQESKIRVDVGILRKIKVTNEAEALEVVTDFRNRLMASVM